MDCLNTTCGLLPFRVFNEPDQVYRLWIALFMHAGLLHLLLSITFSFSILRHVEKRLGWLRTAILYIISGVGGNLVNAFFAPYNPEVRGVLLLLSWRVCEMCCVLGGQRRGE